MERPKSRRVVSMDLEVTADFVPIIADATDVTVSVGDTVALSVLMTRDKIGSEVRLVVDGDESTAAILSDEQGQRAFGRLARSRVR